MSVIKSLFSIPQLRTYKNRYCAYLFTHSLNCITHIIMYNAHTIICTRIIKIVSRQFARKTWSVKRKKKYSFIRVYVCSTYPDTCVRVPISRCHKRSSYDEHDTSAATHRRYYTRKSVGEMLKNKTTPLARTRKTF